MKRVVHEEHLDSDHWWFRARRSILSGFLDALVPLPARARMLDIGPGSGVNLPVLRGRGEVTVVDLSRFSLDSCRAAGAAGVVQADATHPPFHTHSFDLVCALDVLEHLPDDRAALRQIRRILKPDGWLLVSVPALRVLWGRQDVLSEHYRRYLRGQLEERLLSSGFRVERLSYFNSVLFAPILSVRLAMRPFLRWSVRGGSDLGMRLPPGLDALLYRLFAMEGPWLVRRDLPVGVSLLALARPGVSSPQGPSGDARYV